MSAVLLKHEELYERLWEELIKLSPGDKFLSIREIMKNYGVSQLTADKTLMRLREEGYLKVCPGRGLFASELIGRFRTVSERPCYLLAVPRWKSVDIDVLEQTVKNAAGAYPGNRLLVHKFEITSTVPRALPLQEENVAGIVLLSSSNDITFDDLECIKSYQRPVVMLGHHLNNHSLPCVGTDDTFAGNLAADYLEKHGHRHIAVLLSEPHNDIIMTRVKAVCDYAELRGMKAEVIDCKVKSGEVAAEKAYREFAVALRSQFKFSAVIGISGESFQGAVNACHNLRVKIPDDLSMIAIGAESLTDTFYPPITTVAVDFAAQVRSALELLDRQIHGIPSVHGKILQRPCVIERGSVNNIK